MIKEVKKLIFSLLLLHFTLGIPLLIDHLMIDDRKPMVNIFKPMLRPKRHTAILNHVLNHRKIYCFLVS